MSGIKNKILNLIEAGNDTTGDDFTNLTDVIQALIDGYGGVASIKYSHYMSHISPIDGFYNSHSYDAVFIKNNVLYVFYTQAPSHYTDKTDSTTSLMLCKYNIATKSVISNTVILNPARCFWHGAEVDGVYYLFAESGTKYRLSTTDFENFTESSWTAPSSFSNMNYIIVGANNRLICTTGQTTKQMRIFYSDDLGLTWTLASGYADAVTTHGGFAHLGNGRIVLYCQDSYSGNTSGSVTENAHTTKRVVMLSEDNGETWTGALCANADLADCGVTYSSGSFCKIDDIWYFGTSRRLIEKQESGTYMLGDIRIFKGTETDVIHGTMSLFKTVDIFDTGATSISASLIDIQSDSGNMCMKTDGSALYLVYHKPLLHEDTSSYTESTSMVCLAIADRTRMADVADDYYDANWEAERDALISDKDTSYDLYAYGTNTNIGNGIYTVSDYPKIESSDIVPSGVLSIPFTNEFEIKTVFFATNRQINSQWADQYVGANIDGDVYVFGGTTNNYFLNRPNSSAGGTCSLGSARAMYHYFTLKLSNGTVSAKLNGRTISDFKCPATILKRNIPDGYIHLTLGDMASFLPTYTQSAKVQGFKALAINTDGDVLPLLGWPITYNGQNCTFSDTSEYGKYNYTCQVIPDSGYEIQSITYTMGGVEHSVKGDTINIAEITDKVVINAVCVEETLELVTDGLIAYYDLGDETTIDSDGTAHSSINDSSYTAWTSNTNRYATKSGGVKPAIFSHGYCNSPAGFNVVLGGQSLGDISETEAVTLEYLMTLNSNSQNYQMIGGAKTSGGSTAASIFTYAFANIYSPSGRVFNHIVFVLSASDVKIYVNGALKKTEARTDAMNVTSFAVGSTANTDTATYLGHVRIYDRALAEAEMTKNYKYFAAYNLAGQTAYDSSGNFVGW